MKHFKSFIFILLTFCTSNLLAQDKYIPVSQTPEQIKTYIKNHFPATTISSVKKEKELLNYELEVKLNDSTKLTFNYRAIWLKDTLGSFMRSKSALLYRTEDILIFSKMNPKHDLELKHPIRKWLKDTQEKVGIFWNDNLLSTFA